MLRTLFIALLYLVSFSLSDAITCVLTGGAGVGKTTVINALQKQGYQTAPEMWTLLYNQAKENGTVAAEFADPERCRKKLMDMQLTLEQSLDVNQCIFLDRSTIDNVAFAYYHNEIVSLDMLDIIKKKRYDLVFFLDPLPATLYQKEICSREDSIKIHHHLMQFYTELGYDSIHVPFDTPEKVALTP